ncbi:hypothetical protein OsJ_25090 [Oryza sativa Japonica Group]|uniref:DC1 domain-containing protein n=1 Tax=Oryza sativa subsp. japonica TaxID=39947 RepID=B9FYD4_ORYSJ|nr:hypothetical protein OsJ_25090 [Oryza sativa Japonica Group]
MASARYTTWLHPEHSLTRRVYGGKRGAAGVCNVCDRTISGGSYGYRCGGGAACGGFDVHEACLTLPKRVKLGRRHRDHELTLSVLTASRRSRRLQGDLRRRPLHVPLREVEQKHQTHTTDADVGQTARSSLPKAATAQPRATSAAAAALGRIHAAATAADHRILATAAAADRIRAAAAAADHLRATASAADRFQAAAVAANWIRATTVIFGRIRVAIAEFGYIRNAAAVSNLHTTPTRRKNRKNPT